MFAPVRKFVALFLAIWLPFFSGNALADSIMMQAVGKDCPMMSAGVDQPHSHLEQLQDMQLAMDPSHATPSHATPDQQGGCCNDSAVCHFACISYLATRAIAVKENPPSAQTYNQLSTHFQSITSAPLDPPPLTCV